MARLELDTITEDEAREFLTQYAQMGTDALMNKDNTWSAQVALTKIGYNAGPVDGLQGRRTRGGLNNYLNDKLLNSSDGKLAIGDPLHSYLKSEGITILRELPKEKTPEEVVQDCFHFAKENGGFVNGPGLKNLQEALTNLGYDAGPADGVMGSRTREGIMQYCEANAQDLELLGDTVIQYLRDKGLDKRIDAIQEKLSAQRNGPPPTPARQAEAELIHNNPNNVSNILFNLHNHSYGDGIHHPDFQLLNQALHDYAHDKQWVGVATDPNNDTFNVATQRALARYLVENPEHQGLANLLEEKLRDNSFGPTLDQANGTPASHQDPNEVSLALQGLAHVSYGQLETKGRDEVQHLNDSLVRYGEANGWTDMDLQTGNRTFDATAQAALARYLQENPQHIGISHQHDSNRKLNDFEETLRENGFGPSLDQANGTPASHQDPNEVSLALQGLAHVNYGQLETKGRDEVQHLNDSLVKYGEANGWADMDLQTGNRTFDATAQAALARYLQENPQHIGISYQDNSRSKLNDFEETLRNNGLGPTLDQARGITPTLSNPTDVSLLLEGLKNHSYGKGTASDSLGHLNDSLVKYGEANGWTDMDLQTGNKNFGVESQAALARYLQENPSHIGLLSSMENLTWFEETLRREGFGVALDQARGIDPDHPAPNEVSLHLAGLKNHSFGATAKADSLEHLSRALVQYAESKGWNLGLKPDNRQTTVEFEKTLVRYLQENPQHIGLAEGIERKLRRNGYGLTLDQAKANLSGNASNIRFGIGPSGI